MSGDGNGLFAIFEDELGDLLRSCTHPAERRIRFGNLRCEICPACDNGGVTNAAVVYETPGGSTTQINVAYDEDKGAFSYLSDDLRETLHSSNPHEVVEMIRRHTEAIPEKRLQALRDAVDRWLSEGKTRREMFSEMNKLLQNEFLGGRITNDELKAGIQHIVRQASADERN